MARRLSELCIVACSLLSCVKENRMDCPCLLDLTMSGGKESIVTVSLWDPGLRQSEQFNTLGGKSRQECMISRGNFILTASSGTQRDPAPSGDIVVAPGEQMDELYAFSCTFTALGEDASQEVVLHKQFALLNISLLAFNEAEPLPELEVKGNVCGASLTTLSPIPGEYSVTLQPYMGNRYKVCIPRQTDDSLLLCSEDFEIPLGEYIAATGYNWKDEDLKDIDVEVDLMNLTVSITIKGWMSGEIFNITI